ncbi:similar to Saccharomyces cerevisiae YBR204C LDH1 Serine hydrolase [Maudiozyma barnettii]|uniref:Similar to Saccharomyces cerevisiae YBR204C LDH1 Serine hydrolase n=1 Tax=Maudiozyma barnettii TaxID=61262 RepID=A0A8H2VDT5_9SACH|nr:triacylglycerol lipase [Kazachstania barnettii]CAB4253692.1 similar to Saccharomyces cerevisiae YBR204C LDH1 Serine hydrolase [Kazachstania barnettii]CAD1781416.1 similar to Saccharomyces cerevisiae YBR204C LDH1 Serine hydrolase [Kazachstania barnettii]
MIESSEDNLQKLDIIQYACSLDGQPISGKSVHDIVESYTDGPQLARQVSASVNDFRTRFIMEHESFVTIRNIQIRVNHNLSRIFDTDDEDTEIDFFIHGLGGNLEQFEPILRLDDLCNRYFIAIDLPGFGKSEEYVDYSMGTIVDVVHETLIKILQDSNKKKSNIKFNVIGHSMGCYISLHYFQKYIADFHLRSLILLSPPKVYIPQLRKGYSVTQLGLYALSVFPSAFDYYRTRFDQSRGLKSSGIRDFFHNNSHDNIDLQYRKLWQYQNNIQIKSKSIVGYLRGWEQIDWGNLDDLIKSQSLNSSIKLLIIGGNQDAITPISDIQMFFDTLPIVNDKRLEIIESCSHNICFDCPEKICKIFLKDVLKQV